MTHRRVLLDVGYAFTSKGIDDVAADFDNALDADALDFLHDGIIRLIAPFLELRLKKVFIDELIQNFFR